MLPTHLRRTRPAHCRTWSSTVPPRSAAPGSTYATPPPAASRSTLRASRMRRANSRCRARALAGRAASSCWQGCRRVSRAAPMVSTMMVTAPSTRPTSRSSATTSVAASLRVRWLSPLAGRTGPTRTATRGRMLRRPSRSSARPRKTTARAVTRSARSSSSRFPAASSFRVSALPTNPSSTFAAA